MKNIEKINRAVGRKIELLAIYKQMIEQYEVTKNPIIKESIKYMAICIRNEDEIINLIDTKAI